MTTQWNTRHRKTGFLLLFGVAVGAASVVTADPICADLERGRIIAAVASTVTREPRTPAACLALNTEGVRNVSNELRTRPTEISGPTIGYAGDDGVVTPDGALTTSEVDLEW